jgi:hypothetical protein
VVLPIVDAVVAHGGHSEIGSSFGRVETGFGAQTKYSVSLDKIMSMVSATSLWLQLNFKPTMNYKYL